MIPMTPADTLVSRARAIDALPENLTAAELADAIDPRILINLGDGEIPAYNSLVIAADFIRATCPPATTFPAQLRNLAQKWADKNETHAAMMIRKAADVIEGKA